MRAPDHDIVFTPSVKAAQTRLGSRATYAHKDSVGGWNDVITDDLAAFIAERDSFYLGTASAEGRPYIQHRGGPAGFLEVRGERTLAFADLGGNRQYISVGNLAENDRAFIFLMDYEHRRRVKIWGRARFVEDDLALLDDLADRTGRGRPERALVFEVEAWDVNCPEHITRRYTEEQVAERERALLARIAQLEADNERMLTADI